VIEKTAGGIVLSIYERIERMQEKDADKISGEFSVNLKSGINIPMDGFPLANPNVRIMLNSEDE
jgi:hypothetical protein